MIGHSQIHKLSISLHPSLGAPATMECDIGTVSLIGSRSYNQDTYFIERGLFGHANQFAFGVLDGHGQHGHLVANAVRGTHLFVVAAGADRDP